MLSDFLHRIARERAAAVGRARRRPIASLFHYAVLGAVALSILPASAAASLPTPATNKSGTRGNSEPKRAPTRRAQQFEAAADNVRRPPRVDTRPFKDLLLKGKSLYDAGRLDLRQTVELNVEGDRNDDGTLTNLSMTGRAATDPSLRELAQETFAALSQSRVLQFLEGTRHLHLKLVLDEQKLAVTSRAEVASEERARQMANGYGGLLAIARFRERERPSGVVWNHMGFHADGKQFAATLEMSREEAGRLLLQLITPN